jgi:hypothetical protein
MITLFTTTKPFIGKNAIIQTNALKSWKLLKPECEIIVFGDSSGTDKICRDLGLIHIPEIQCNEFGTPLLNDLFEKAKKMSNHEIICYVNADIILMSDFIESIKIILKTEKQFLMVGQRWDYDIDKLLEYTPDWELKLKESVIQSGTIHARTGIDYFAFNIDLFNDIPPFAIGRTAWDNWLLSAAIKSGAKLIDSSSSVMCIHQNHDWSHIKGGEKEAWEGTEAINNQTLAQGHILTLDDAEYFLTSNGITRDVIKRAIKYVKKLKIKLRSFNHKILLK